MYSVIIPLAKVFNMYLVKIISPTNATVRTLIVGKGSTHTQMNFTQGIPVVVES